MKKTRLIGALCAGTASAVLLAGCASTADEAAEATTTEPTTTTAVAATTTESTTTPATTTPTGSAEDTTPAAAAGALDGVQIVLNSSEEVSPGTLQYSWSSLSGRIEWKALSGRTVYDGEKCVAVITLLDPAGNVLQTDRQSTCTGSTDFYLRSSKNGTGDYAVTLAMSDWATPDEVVEDTMTFTVIAEGS